MGINKRLKKNFQELSQVRLNKDDKLNMRKQLSAFVEHNDKSTQEDFVSIKNGGRLQTWEYVFSPLKNLYLLTKKNMHALLAKPVSVALGVFIAANGGLAAAAQFSTPEDFLYNYKVHVNENVREALAISAKSQAEVSLSLAAERLEEAEKLAAKGKLDVETREKIEARFNKHLAKGQEVLAKLHGKKAKKLVTASDIEAEFEGEFKAHAKVLAKISEKNEKFADLLSATGDYISPDTDSVTGDNGTDQDTSQIGAMAMADLTAKETAKLKAHLEEKLKVKSLFKLSIDEDDDDNDDPEEDSENDDESTRLDSQAAAEGKLKSAENKIESTLRFIESKKVKADAEIQVEVDAKIQASQTLMTQGKTELEAGNYAAAFALFKQAHQSAQEAKIFLIQSIKIHAATKRANEKSEHSKDKNSKEVDQNGEPHEPVKTQGFKKDEPRKDGKKSREDEEENDTDDEDDDDEEIETEDDDTEDDDAEDDDTEDDDAEDDDAEDDDTEEEDDDEADLTTNTDLKISF